MTGVSAHGPYLSPGEAARLLLVSPCALTLGGHRRFRADVIAAVAASLGLGDRQESDDAS